jgi:A/G-specific adenine glycosylase
MLQQTQAPRVVPFYTSWIRTFPTIATVAQAPLETILREWRGLGYNRRALNLKRASETITREYSGNVPRDVGALTSLPGIGPYTARAIKTFSWNDPEVFIETNIRSVYIHFYFPHKETVRDSEILPLIEKTLEKERAREWYWALMDYGAWLKKTQNPSRKSVHYSSQSPFKGSNREIRSLILTRLTDHPATMSEIRKDLEERNLSTEKLRENLMRLKKEGFLKNQRGTWSIQN